MSTERVQRLRRWHDDAYQTLRKRLPLRMSYLGLDLYVPEDVFAPTGTGAFHRAVRDEVKPTDRVLDMGTGSGISAILAAKVSSNVVAVDINPKAIVSAIANAARNGVGGRVRFLESDVFDAVEGEFDLIIFDPPFRWFAPRDLLEMGTADENYRALTRFMTEAKSFLRSHGRIMLNFGTSGDLDYLNSLIERTGFKKTAFLRRKLTKNDLTVSYYTIRLTI
jgi:release factor glutamine methyltransferase